LIVAYFGLVLGDLFVFKLQDSAIYSEEETEFKAAFGNRVGVEI
jgi:hypothetical protein